MIIAVTTQGWDIVNISMLRGDRKNTAGPTARRVRVGIEDVP